MAFVYKQNNLKVYIDGFMVLNTVIDAYVPNFAVGGWIIG